MITLLSLPITTPRVVLEYERMLNSTNDQYIPCMVNNTRRLVALEHTNRVDSITRTHS